MSLKCGTWKWNLNAKRATAGLSVNSNSSTPVRLAIGANANGSLTLGNFANTTVMLAAEPSGFQALISEGSSTNVAWRFGMMLDASDTDGGARAIMFRGDSSGAGTIECITRNASASTITTTALSIVISTRRLAVDIESGRVRFWSNGVLVATHITTIPTGSVNFGIQCEALSATAKNMDIGQVLFRFPPLAFP